MALGVTFHWYFESTTKERLITLTNTIGVVITDFHLPMAGAVRKSMEVIQSLPESKGSVDRGRVEGTRSYLSP